MFYLTNKLGFVKSGMIAITQDFLIVMPSAREMLFNLCFWHLYVLST